VHIVKNQITDLIQKRVSVRTYNNQPMRNSDIEKINKFIEKSNGPFEPRVRFKLLRLNEDINGAKLGTYGVIKGTQIYLGVCVEEGDMDLEELGYEMESLILYATSLGLGTCFIAGTFNKVEFTKVMYLNDREIFPIISPIGYPANRKSIVDKLFRIHNKTGKRKSLEEIFFLEDFNSPLGEKDSLGEFDIVLENLRLAPSAVNNQPWRVVKSGEDFHFYKVDGKNTYRVKGIDLNRIDMGIALCHFDLSCKDLGISGIFIKREPEIECNKEELKYIITWTKID
jgi:nitroreductase